MTNEPTYSFTIPSIGDDLQLDCRLYVPTDLATVMSQNRLRGAVVAHPYAPLGGCYGDSVVLSVKDTLLGIGYVVATFNFRGAGESAGRPSWTGHPEIEDYTSVVGLLVYYIQRLQIQAPGDSHDLAPINQDLENEDLSARATPNEPPIRLLLAGYSFGSLILARLPPISRIIDRFETAEKGTAAAEIFLRARMLARQTQASIRRPSTPRGRDLDPSELKARSSPVTVGGEETDPSQRRRSQSKHSTDIIREVPHKIKTHIRRHSGSKQSIDHNHRPSTTSLKGPAVSTTYLLISPVLLPLTTMLLPPGVPNSLALPFGLGGSHADSGVFSWQSQTLLLFGSDDNFTSAKKLRGWAEKMQKQSSGALQWKEIEGAGHFWREDGVLQTLSSRITSWDASNSSVIDQR